MYSAKSLAIIVLYVAILEAWIFWNIYSWKRPNKKIRDKIASFADAKGISQRKARDYIFTLFFYVYDKGLKEVILKPQKSESQLFEEWKAEQDKKFQEELKKLQEEEKTKLIVKPKKVHPEE